MRTTVFAFMGLMAAGGLTLVAIFAQMGFPLVTPEPLPSDPSQLNAVAEAEVVTVRRGLGSAVPAPRAVQGEGHRAEGGATAGGTLRNAEGEAPSGPVVPPAGSGGVSTPAEGGGAGAPATAPGPAPAPAPKPAPTSAPKPAPALVPPTPQQPEAKPPSPAPPAPVAAPGNSSSGAAAAHASERGIEASSKSTASSAVASPVPPDNGNALGHDK